MFKPLADKLTSATTSAKAGAKALGEKAAAVKEQLADKFKEHPSADGTLMVGDTRSFKATLCGYDFEGCSIAGQETCIVVPRCKVAFDIGRCPQRSVPMQTVLFSHGHLDHIGGIHFHAASRALGGMPPPKYILPPHLEAPAKQLLEASWAVAGSPDIPYEILPLSPGQEYVLPSGFIARPFATCHRVPSQGYILYSQRKKLRAELQGKSQEEIREVRASGEEVTTTFEVPEIAFTGDTSVELLEAAGTEDLFKARVLIMELTFLDDQVPMDTARERGHMHLADFVTHAHKFQNEAILLIHMSSRYQRNDIIDILNTGLPPALRAKCVPFLNGFD